MAQGINRQITLASHPEGEPAPANFGAAESPIPEPGAGQLLLRNKYLSLDPYMRGRMGTAKSYAKGFQVGEALGGGTVSEVVVSNNPKYVPGDLVLAHGGWQDYALSGGEGLRRIDPDLAPVTTALGVLGMPGMTAYTGLLNIGDPKPGETVVVAAAAGPVGATVGQIAKLKGCRTVGIAAAGKLDCLKQEFGFDAALDRRSPAFQEELRDACPMGIDVYFENVGGAVWEAVLPLLNDFARIPVCGLIAHYNDTELPPGPDRMPMLMRMVLIRRLRIQGFIVSDSASQRGDFLRDVGAWVREGKIGYREHIVEGLEQAPEAFIALLRGDNFGKTIVKIAD
jgi:NADPH-dependent curcumin reductase CurA